MRVTSNAPCRVDLAGATLDIWPLYLFHQDAVTLNFAVNLYTSCAIATREDTRIAMRSDDLGLEESFGSLAHLCAAPRFRLPIPALLVRFFAPFLDPAIGLTIKTRSEAPAGAGISGSSSLMISVASALNKLTGAGFRIEKLREIAQNIEAQVIRVPTGAQDYYPALYGGASAIEFGPAGICRKELSIDPDELDRRFVLAYTGAPRNSGINNWEVMKGYVDGDRAIQRNFTRIALGANAMRGALERADWAETARLMRDDWAFRRRNIPGITTPAIDRLIARARTAGATAAKACGAGGGGCVVFLVEPDAKERVAQSVRDQGSAVLDAAVSRRGLRVR